MGLRSCEVWLEKEHENERSQQNTKRGLILMHRIDQGVLAVGIVAEVAKQAGVRHFIKSHKASVVANGSLGL